MRLIFLGCILQAIGFAQGGVFLISDPTAIERFYTSGDPNKVKNCNNLNAWLKDNNGREVDPEAFVNSSSDTKYFITYTALYRTYFFSVKDKASMDFNFSELKKFITRITEAKEYKGRITASTLIVKPGEQIKWGKGIISLTSTGKYETGLIIDDSNDNKIEDYIPPFDWKNDNNPSTYTLEQWAPSTRSQGSASSCVGWATAYAAMTILRAMNENKTGDECIMSPAFVYNQLTQDCKRGLIMRDALELLKEKGTVPYYDFEYDENNCTKQPDASTKEKARAFRLKGFYELFSETGQQESITYVKQHILQNFPVVISMYVGNSFKGDRSSIVDDRWYPTATDFSGFSPYSGGWHALCAIGFDDFKFGDDGGILLINSWGKEFEDNDGRVWISYKAFKHFVRKAYAMYLNTTASNSIYTPDFEIAVAVQGKDALLRIEKPGDNDSFIFCSAQTDFQFRIKNKMPCYSYILELNQGKAKVIFPLEYQSPNFTIIANRLLPSSAISQTIGLPGREFLILISGDPIDIHKIASVYNNSKNEKVQQMMDFTKKSYIFIHDSQLEDNTINFKTDWKKSVINVIPISVKPVKSLK